MSSFDSFTLAAVFKELQQAKGAYIEQIYQPTKTELIINLQQLSRHKKLLLSIHPSFARLHYT
ncbi:MAG: hypothetical protein GX764_00775, partial [Firmicutes bacterium]|nr:hypothetical protein [Bacillota bacterium]